MTKEDKIKEAYGKYFKSSNIDENGWTNILTDGFLSDIPCDTKHTVYGNPEWWYRPKSLSGIENNNGWIKIESEKYLPKEIGYYWVINKVFDHGSNIDFEHFDLRINSTKELWMKFITHYQPIEKLKPPIY